jgi:hypothetical protein
MREISRHFMTYTIVTVALWDIPTQQCISTLPPCLHTQSIHSQIRASWGSSMSMPLSIAHTLISRTLMWPLHFSVYRLPCYSGLLAIIMELGGFVEELWPNLWGDLLVGARCLMVGNLEVILTCEHYTVSKRQNKKRKACTMENMQRLIESHLISLYNPQLISLHNLLIFLSDGHQCTFIICHHY